MSNSTLATTDRDSIYIYIDETIFKDKHIGVCALETHSPITSDIISRALEDLKCDPDRSGNKQDDATIRRGHFHASEDSKNSHSHLARHIKLAINGIVHFSYIPFQNNAEKENDFRQNTALSFMMTLKSTRAATIFFEKRQGFSVDIFQTQIEKLYKNLDRMAYEKPFVPTFYPRLNIVPSDKSNPGIQIADYLLWALNWQLFEPSSKNAEWLKRAGSVDYGLSEIPLEISDRGGKFGWYTLNRRLPDDLLNQLARYPKNIRMDSQSSEETLRYYINAERIVHSLANTQLPPHMSHFSLPLINLSRDLRNPKIIEPKKVMSVASMFLRLFDTLPLYSDLSSDSEEFAELMRMRKYMGLLFHENLFPSVRTLLACCQMRQTLMATNATQLGFSKQVL